MRKQTVAGACALVLFCSTAMAQNLKFAPGEDSRFNWQSFEDFAARYDLSGQEMTLFGPWLGPDKDLIESIVAYFEEATGADVAYSGSDSFEQQIVIDAQAGSAPNVAVFPQPGLAANLAAQGYLTPLGGETADWLRENYAAGQSWVDLSTYPDKDGNAQLFAFPYKIDVKSLVWYVPENFEDAGYEVPQTMEELKALTEQIVADGGTPWCIGLGSGGAKAVASTDFRDSPAGLFSFPPGCYMHRQASFIPSFFPEGTELGVDADFFYFPPYGDKDLGNPVLGAGTLFAITADSEAARAFIEFLKTPIAHELWMAQSGFLTPFTKVNPDAYANDALKKQGEILTNATTFRFDASDLMPGRIGAGAFWTGMVDYVSGKSAEEVTGDIQREWDAIK